MCTAAPKPRLTPCFFAQRGAFSATQRAACFGSKAVQFSCLGAATSAAGQALTKGLVGARRRLQPGGGSDDVQLAPILPTSCAYAAFMGASSNTRYQLVNTFEALALPAFPAPTRNVVSAAVRTGNNFIGSSNWIWWAKRCGLQ